MKRLFFSNQRQDWVVDERCTCSHAKSEHGSRTTRLDGTLYREHSDGSCCAQDCDCDQFRWAGWVTLGDVEKAQAKLTTGVT